MKKYSFENDGKTFERITKKNALKAYNSGVPVFLCPVNMRPFTPWNFEICVDKSSGRSFDSTLNEFEYYNCNRETGMYTAFYIQSDF